MGVFSGDSSDFRIPKSVLQMPDQVGIFLPRMENPSLTAGILADARESRDKASGGGRPGANTHGDWLELDHSDALGLSEFKTWRLQVAQEDVVPSRVGDV